jgi:hypothetical protein
VPSVRTSKARYLLVVPEFYAESTAMSDNPITDFGAMIRWTIQFPEDDLVKLADLQCRSRMSGREWMRALLAALVEYHELKGSVTLPLAVVPRAEAEKAGLLPPQEKRSPSKSEMGER